MAAQSASKFRIVDRQISLGPKTEDRGFIYKWHGLTRRGLTFIACVIQAQSESGVVYANGIPRSIDWLEAW